ncbi:four helix bundle protein [Aureibaculum marinum]|uniref:Four helix bundle protein n=1 Tax=Aureibaculum marinum TaxID=2487930 RepID=A0A3N4NN33_9FLAO|nr:four helix bundle protein [Aureibaculum marinum]RPD97714.1 four helix bundle protein [Aureibaculum marinum]
MAFKDLLALKKSFRLVMKIVEISKKLPKEETYALTNQIRSLSRNITVNISEVYRNRLYPKHFISRLTSTVTENSY